MDCLLGIAILFLVPDYNAIARFVLQQLCHRIPTDCCCDGVLYVGSIDSESRGRLTVYHKVEVWLTHVPKESKILNSRHSRHHGGNFLALFLQGFQIVSE